MQENSLAEIFRKSFTHDERFEEALGAMRRAGASQMDCVKVVMAELKISLKDADQLVLYSRTWANHLESALKLRDHFLDIFIEGPGDEETATENSER